MSTVLLVVRRIPRGFARVVLSLLFMSLLVVACQPSNCQTTSTTARITCDGKSPGDNCPAPWVRTCVTQCRAVAGPGEACVVDACATGDALETPEKKGKICDRNFACVPDSAGAATGKCAPALAECDPNAPAADSNRCQGGTHCVPYVDVTRAPEGKRAHCPIPDVLVKDGKPLSPGMCLPFIPEGQACDSDAEAGESLPLDEVDCRPCEPGTQCVRLTGEKSGTCLRKCDRLKSSESCPCDDACVQATSVESSAPGTYCTHCVATKQACHAPGTDHTAACCNPDDTCFGDSCCRRTGKACKDTGECCGDDKCLQGTCSACKSTGTAAQDASECCPGLVIENIPGKGTVCSPPCGAKGEPCCLQTTCDGGMVCGGGKCQSCGAAGQPCCAGNACGTGATCTNGACQSCGGPNQPCCGTTCAGGASCTSGVCKPPTSCGLAGLACCPGAVCSDGSTCTGGKCESCGSDGQKCCGVANTCTGKAAPGARQGFPMVCLYADTSSEKCATPYGTCGVRGTPCCLGLCDVGLACIVGVGCQ